MVLKEFPVLGPGALLASRAAFAAKAQGKYVDFHKAIYSGGRQIKEEKVMAVAESIGLDVARLKEDMESPEFDEAIGRNKALAKTLGIWKTPTLVFGDKVRIGGASLKTLQELVATQRA